MPVLALHCLYFTTPPSHSFRQTDALIQGVLHDAVAGGQGGRQRTMLVIAHRVDTIMDCDQLLVLGKGRLLESGPPRQLAKSSGVFSRLVSAAAANAQQK